MKEMIAYCGLVCSDCPTFNATRMDDDAARQKIASHYLPAFGLHYRPEEINCTGCPSEGGQLLDFCITCGIRKCCRQRKLDNCTLCESQPCEELERFHRFSPQAKAAFNKLLTKIL